MISAVIGNYNAGRFLPDAIRSVLAQRTPPREILVVDDGSTDDSRARAEPFLDRVQWLGLEHRGQGAALAEAVGRCKGDWVAFLESDDTWSPDKLAAVSACAAERPGLVAIAHYMTQADAALTPLPTLWASESRDWGLADFLAGRAPLTGMSALTVRRDALARLIPLPADLSTCVDEYLQPRLLEAGPVHHLALGLGLRRIHGGNFYAEVRKDAGRLKAYLALRDVLDRHLELFLAERKLKLSSKTTLDRAVERMQLELFLNRLEGNWREALGLWSRILLLCRPASRGLFKGAALLTALASPALYTGLHSGFERLCLLRAPRRGGLRRCPACAQEAPADRVEAHLDRIELKGYAILACSACGVAFSEPRVAVGPGWYSMARFGEAVGSSGDWRHRAALGLLPRGRILDVGCGAGQFLLAAQAAGFKVSGLDFNAEHVEQAKASGARDAVAMDFRAFFDAQAPGTFDGITLFDVLEHVPEPAELLARIQKALRRGGLLAVTVPNAGRPVPSACLREEWDYPPYHFTRWTAASLGRVLERHGFRVLERRYSPLPLGFFSALLYFRLLRSLFPLLKRLVLGRRAAEGGRTWTELLGKDAGAPASRGGLKGALADAGARQRLTDAGLKAFYCLFWLVETPLILLLRASAATGGTLFLAAERE